MGINSIYNLRSAILQTGDSSEEMKKVKEEMKQALRAAEEKLLEDLVKSIFGLRKIEEASKVRNSD